jgi:hypothetical protein
MMLFWEVGTSQLLSQGTISNNSEAGLRTSIHQLSKSFAPMAVSC